MKETWYHVIEYPKAYGFSICNGIITNHPDWFWKGCPIEQLKPSLIRAKAKVYEIKS